MGSITHGTKPNKQPHQGRSKAVRVLAILLALLLLVPLVLQIVQVSSYAVTQQDIDSLSSQQAQLEEQKGKLQTQLDKLSKQENSAADRCSVLNDQIDLLNQQVDNTRAMVDDYTKQIKASQKELDAAKAEEEKYYDLFCQRVRNMEENGSTSYWQILFGASDFSDLLDRASFVSSVMEYDNGVLDGLEQAREKVDATTQALQEKKASKEKALSKLEAQQQEINATAKEAEAALKEVRDNRSTYSAQLSQMNAQTEDLAEEIVTAKSAYAAEQKAAAEEAKRQQKAAEEAQKRQEEEARREQEAQQQPTQTDKDQNKNNNKNKNENNNKNDQQKPSKEEPKKEPTKEPEQQPEQKPEEPKPSKPSVSGAAVAAYAMQFIGGKYVWGGANLATGVDCSGFVMCVYQHFGYSLPHYSESLAGCGRGVSYANAQPGDIICYRGHCGIYIGGGMMVNALGAKYGIVVNQVNTSRLTAVRRIV